MSVINSKNEKSKIIIKTVIFSFLMGDWLKKKLCIKPATLYCS